MMDELVQDMVSALEQASEQSKMGELWEEMVLSPLHQRRQIRRRRGRKRYRESSLFRLDHRRCWIEASESSLDETKEHRKNSSSSFGASLANCSDSDDMTSTYRWRSVVRGPVRHRQPAWPESHSYTNNNPGRPIRRRRKVKHMTSDVTVRLQQKLKSSSVDGKRRQKTHLPGSKKRSGGWMGPERQTDGARLMGKECWKRKMTKDHRDGADENMSEGESSSTCSSDPGLFTNDEGRQGDDEQSDWFFDGDCGVGTGVASLLSDWDSDNQISLEGKHPSPTFLQPARPPHRGYQYHSRLKQVPGSAACCIRKDRRRLPRKGHRIPMFVERLRHYSQDLCQRDFWLPSVGKRERNQWNSLCPLPVCPIDLVSESSHLRCSSSVCRNSIVLFLEAPEPLRSQQQRKTLASPQAAGPPGMPPLWCNQGRDGGMDLHASRPNASGQTSSTPGVLCTGGSGRRREPGDVSVTTSANNPFQKDHQREAQEARNTTTLEALGLSAQGSHSSPSAETESLSFFHGGQ